MTDDEFLILAYEDDDWTWSDPIPDGARHAMPGEDGLLPCCGRRHEAIPQGDHPMTTTAIRSTESTATPQSQDLTNLLAMLDDPDLAGFREDIQRAIVELRAKSALGA